MNHRLLFCFIFCALFPFSAAKAQVIKDNSLSTEVETENNSDFTVNAGEQRGDNLFHSFAEFSIPTNGSVSFNNGLTIQNIISRVTGSSISNIDGLIQANGTANLFLINPNGIIFGENARLNIGGSFVGTTADSLVFEDGAEFSTNLNDSEPLLTVNVPLGLQFGSNPGEIVNKANFSVPNPLDPTGQDLVKLGLTTLPGKTLALLGGDISFDGGAIASSGGNVELGSVAENSFVVLEAFGAGFRANYDSVEQFQDIQLTDLASVDASGEGGGNINVRGRNIRLFDGSAITSNTLGSVDGETITVEASDLVEISGSDRTGTKVDFLLIDFEIFFPLASQIASSTFGAGKAGDIEIITNNLQLIDGGEINLLTFPGSTGVGGDLFIFANGFVSLRGSRPLLGIGENTAEIIQVFNPSLSLDDAIELNQSSAITNSSISAASGGDINIESGTLRLEDGAGVGTSPFRQGDAGNVNITATESIEIIGVSERTGSIGSGIASNTFSEANAGDINLETGRLSLFNGGIIISSTSIVGGGDAGNITVNSQLTEIKGVSSSSQEPSLLSSQTNNESIGGNIFINSENLVVSDRGTISIRGTSTGSPGNLQVNANSVLLNNSGQITAENAMAVAGGNIEFNISDRLVLEENSLISAQALGNANGGNIEIAGGFVVANPNENSDILATAVRGDGGNINITGEGIFGIQEGSSKPANISNDIDASSEFGMDGTVQVNFPEVRESNFENQKYFKILEVSKLLSSNLCKTSSGSSYYITGKGGMALSPNRDLNIQNSWIDLRFFDGEITPADKIEQEVTTSKVKKIQPIQGWFKDSRGRIVLTAKPLVATSHSSNLPHPNCHTKTERSQPDNR